MTKFVLTVFALAALSTASFAGSFSNYSQDNAGFNAPSDQGGGDRGGDRGSRG